MSEIPVFYKDKQFQRIKEQVERKTNPYKKEELVNKALGTKYFINNKEAAASLLRILNGEEVSFLETGETKVAGIDQPHDLHDSADNTSIVDDSAGNTPISKQKKEPVVVIEGKSVLELGNRFWFNGEYQNALDLYLSDENIKEYGHRARYLAQDRLKDKLEFVAVTLFDHLKTNPETASVFANCAKILGKEQEDMARNIIITRVEEITGSKKLHENRTTKEGNSKQAYQKGNYFSRVKKWLGSTTIVSPTKKLISLDPQVCSSLIVGMRDLGGCNKAIQYLYRAWDKSRSMRKENDYSNTRCAMRDIYENSLISVNN